MIVINCQNLRNDLIFLNLFNYIFNKSTLINQYCFSFETKKNLSETKYLSKTHLKLLLSIN